MSNIKRSIFIAAIMLLTVGLAGCQRSTDTQFLMLNVSREDKEVPVTSVQAEKQKTPIKLTQEFDKDDILYGHDIEMDEIRAFNDMPFLIKDILDMSILERKKMLSPGQYPTGHYYRDTDDLIRKLQVQGKLDYYLQWVTDEQLEILLNLGYELEEIPEIPYEQLDFIFPVEKLKDKLYAVGISDERMRRDYRESDKEFILLAMSQPSEEEFINLAEEKNIYPWERDALIERGFTRAEIINMPKEERSKWLTPGSLDNLDINESTYYLCYSEYYKKLPQGAIDKGITKEMAESLVLLGYQKEEMAEMSQEELDFIFPLTELRGKLNDCGFSNREITAWERRLKYIIRECLGLL